MKNFIRKTGIMAAIFSAGLIQAENLKDIEESFYPYKSGVPEYAGLKAGMVINSANVDKFKDILDPVIFQQVKDGLYEFPVGETTSFDLNNSYVEATRKNLNKVTLGDNAGELQNFVAGRPFPGEPSVSDPRAGEKLAFNYKYGYNWGDSATILPLQWKMRDMTSGKVERSIKTVQHFLNWKHRVNQAPMPEFKNNPADLFRAIYIKVLEPFDVKNTQLLIHRYDDDTKVDNAWLYLGFQRRVRRLASGQITDSFLGSDLTIEDIEGYNGRISDMNWTYKGTKNLLLPFYNHNEQELGIEDSKKDGYRFIDFTGKGSCFPKVSWQLRKTYILEAAPKNKNHPLSKRVFHIDAQTFTLPRTLIYDRKGDLWKSFTITQAHPDHHLAKNKGSGVSIDDGFSMIDVQSSHCTTAEFRGEVDASLNPVKLFTVQNMRSTGR